ncbi:MAG: biopolymer transport protein ExbB [Ignavibacteria bacterium]|nr:MAG: biopolymer transport protein ExbB [Ignavibacteria bacterium]KAF0161599.1 MAG: biopolymer transport protein ExbB [Ignavibacteria bacterium]
MFNYGFMELLAHGGFTLFVLIICSVLALKVIIEKWITLKVLETKNLEELSLKVKEAIREKNFKMAQHVCKIGSVKRMGFNITAPLANVFLYMMNNLNYKKEELMDLSFSKMDQELVRLEKGVSILGTLGNIAPFIGLFGTVLGIIRSFEGLSINEASSYLTVMGGIAEALIATAAGILVAVPSVIFYNYFMKRIKLSIPSMETEIKEVLYLLKKEAA